MSVPDTVRHASAQVVFETYPVLGFNYRHDRHPGRDRPRAAARGCRRSSRAGASWPRATPRRWPACRASSPPREPAWARSNWQSYAVRLEPADQRHGDAAHARRRRRHAARRDERPPRGGLPGGHVARGRAARRAASGRRTRAMVLPLFHQMTDDDQDRVVASLAGARRAAVTPMLSILTPAFNEAHEPRRALRARLAATIAGVGVDWEWLIVDDHSRGRHVRRDRAAGGGRSRACAASGWRATPARTWRSPAACTTCAATPP